MAKAKQLSAEKVAQLVAFLEENKGEEVSLGDIMALAEVMAGSLDSYLKAIDKSLYKEFTAIATEISSMKEEISALRPSEMRHSAIPDAGRELDAVVEATETATNTIMSCAEAIMSADPADTKRYHELVNDKVIEIFEACSFQDITGQRISKVVTTLNHIDDRVSTFVERLKMEDFEEANLEETDEERRKRELILHGPQHAGEGVDQKEVDEMLADMMFKDVPAAKKEDSDQTDIDALFS